MLTLVLDGALTLPALCPPPLQKQRLTSSALTASGSGAASTSTGAVLSSLRSSQRAALSKLSDLEWEDRVLPGT